MYYMPTYVDDDRLFFFFQAEDGIRDVAVTGVQTCALPISRGAAARVRGARRATRQGHGLRDARRARGTVAGYRHRAHAAGPAQVPRHARRVPAERRSGMQSIHGSRMSLWAFYARNSQEVLGLVGQHLYLVAISTGAAIVIGVPLGILLTRRPAWRGPLLGVANAILTVPSLALFGLLVPLTL